MDPELNPRPSDSKPSAHCTLTYCVLQDSRANCGGKILMKVTKFLQKQPLAIAKLLYYHSFFCLLLCNNFSRICSFKTETDS